MIIILKEIVSMTIFQEKKCFSNNTFFAYFVWVLSGFNQYQSAQVYRNICFPDDKTITADVDWYFSLIRWCGSCFYLCEISLSCFLSHVHSYKTSHTHSFRQYYRLCFQSSLYYYNHLR